MLKNKINKTALKKLIRFQKSHVTNVTILTNLKKIQKSFCVAAHTPHLLVHSMSDVLKGTLGEHEQFQQA